LTQTAVGKTRELASSETFSRLETRSTRADVVALNRVLVEQFIAAQPALPAEVVLDIDASDVPLHGDQGLPCNWLLFAALIRTLVQRLREVALSGTDLAKVSAATIRVGLLKIGAAVLRNTRRVRILLASHDPLREALLTAARALAP
jgi:Transposase DDE domain group 1